MQQEGKLESRIAAAKHQAQGRWREIFIANGIEESLLRKPNRPCPLCGGRDRFSFTDKFHTGNYLCRGCGAGDGFQLIARFAGCDFIHALERVESFCGIVNTQSQEQTGKRREQGQPSRRRNQLRLWSEASPVACGDSVWRYLQARGLDPSRAGTELRCHQALPYAFTDEPKRVETFAGLLARVTDAQGVVVNLHRTYVADGKKAPVPCPKKLMPGTLRGAAVRLSEPGAVLGLAEGIETALAAQEIFGVPVWATLGVTNLAGFTDVPKTVQSVYIFADNDVNYAGQAGAYTLAHKLAMAGRQVTVYVPADSGSDWLDVLVQMRGGRQNRADALCS